MTGLLTDSEKFLLTVGVAVGLAVGLWLGVYTVPASALMPEAQETVRGRLSKAFLPVPTYLPVLSGLTLTIVPFGAWQKWMTESDPEDGDQR